MNGATVGRLQREVAALSARLAPPRAALTREQVAERAGISPDPWQRDLLRSAATEIIILASRQSGKSTITSVLAAHRAAYAPRSLVLLLSPSLRQSGELYRKVRGVLAALGEAAPPAAEESALRLQLANGSRVLCLPGREATVRGFSAPDLVIEDESARVDDGLYMALRPMLATNPAARLVLLSTPFGRRGHFFREWTEGGPDWHRVRVTAEQCPRIPRDWLARERGRIGDWWFDQEFGCEFKEAEDSAFRAEDIAAALDARVEPLFGVQNAA